MVELVDTLALGASGVTREGSSPFIPTILIIFMTYDRGLPTAHYEGLFAQAGALLDDADRTAGLPTIYQNFLYASKPKSWLRTKEDKVPTADELPDLERRSRLCDYIILMFCVDAAENPDLPPLKIPERNLITSLAHLAAIEEEVVAEEINALGKDGWIRPAKVFAGSQTGTETLPAVRLNPVIFNFTEADLEAIRPVTYPDVEERQLVGQSTS